MHRTLIIAALIAAAPAHAGPPTAEACSATGSALLGLAYDTSLAVTLCRTNPDPSRPPCAQALGADAQLTPLLAAADACNAAGIPIGEPWVVQSIQTQSQQLAGDLDALAAVLVTPR